MEFHNKSFDRKEGGGKNVKIFFQFLTGRRANQ
jgi:hypothetical protein